MKEAFVFKKFHRDSLVMIERINQILNLYVSQGYDLSLRQLYYQLVSKNIVENTEKSYKNVGQLVSDARLAGLIDWNIIKDRGRNTSRQYYCESVPEVIRSSMYGFSVDRWANQPNYVELMVEKQALEGVLAPVCRELHIPFTSNKGYSSSSCMYEASKRYLDKHNAGKNLHVLYLGDHDPSGIDMTRDIDDRFHLFVETAINGEIISPEDLADTARGHAVHRLALNIDQVRKFNPPENPAKLTDSRAEGYIKKFGRSSWELDAIEPRKLAQLVRDAVKPLIDQAQWNEDNERELMGRRELEIFADSYEERNASDE